MTCVPSKRKSIPRSPYGQNRSSTKTYTKSTVLATSIDVGSNDNRNVVILKYFA